MPLLIATESFSSTETAHSSRRDHLPFAWPAFASRRVMETDACHPSGQCWACCVPRLQLDAHVPPVQRCCHPMSNACQPRLTRSSPSGQSTMNLFGAIATCPCASHRPQRVNSGALVAASQTRGGKSTLARALCLTHCPPAPCNGQAGRRSALASLARDTSRHAFGGQLPTTQLGERRMAGPDYIIGTASVAAHQFPIRVKPRKRPPLTAL